MTDLYDYHNGPNLGLEPSDEQIDPATLPGLTAAQRCALGRFAKPRPAGDAQPVAWVAADTLNSPHPACVSSLAYMSQLDREQGREYVPLYAAPVAAQKADAGLDVEAVLRLFLTGDGFIAECDIPHIVAALTAQPAVGEEIMVNAAHDVYTLPLQPSGLDGQGPRFVVHVPPPEPQAAEIEELLAALRQIAEWPDGGNRYGQENIKRFAQAAIDAAMQRTSGGDHADS